MQVGFLDNNVMSPDGQGDGCYAAVTSANGLWNHDLARLCTLNDNIQT